MQVFVPVYWWPKDSQLFQAQKTKVEQTELQQGFIQILVVLSR